LVSKRFFNVKTKTEARREAILAAAKAVFEEMGFEQATMSEITARVGGSKATLYRYFDSKEALFGELVSRSAQEHGGQLADLFGERPCAAIGPGLPPDAMEVLALLDPKQDVEVSLKGFGERVLRTFFTPQKFAMRRMVIAASGNNPEVGRTFYENGPGKGMKLVASYFEAVMKAGKLRMADPHVAASQFRALLDCELEERGLMNALPEFDDAQVVATVARAVDTFMRAYRPD
jgi:AcrR family transcriptional regulator